MRRPAEEGPSSWNQARRREAEEESYFNGDDDDEPIGVGLFPGNGKGGMLKRKRARGSSVPPMRPQQALARAPALGSLLDYDEGDDLDTTEDRPPTPSAGMPISPRIAHRQISIGQPQPDEDPEDALLESLVTPGPPSPSPQGTSPPELGSLKRRREDDDDGLLERLANKSKKASAASSPAQDKPASPSLSFSPSLKGPASPSPSPTPLLHSPSHSPSLKGSPHHLKSGAGAGGGLTLKLGAAKAEPESGPKKIKLKLSGASPTPAPSSPGVKDGDTG